MLGVFMFKTLIIEENQSTFAWKVVINAVFFSELCNLHVLLFMHIVDMHLKV